MVAHLSTWRAVGQPVANELFGITSSSVDETAMGSVKTERKKLKTYYLLHQMVAFREVVCVCAHKVDRESSAALRRTVLGRRVPHQPVVKVTFTFLHRTGHGFDGLNRRITGRHKSAILV